MSSRDAMPAVRHRAFARRSERIQVSATLALALEADRLRAEGRDLVDFGVGEPDFATPEYIRKAAIAALQAGDTKYTPATGTRALREAIVRRHGLDFGTSYTLPEVMATVGGKQALFNAISVLVDHGDEVVLPTPCWVSFAEQIRYAGGTPVEVALDEARGFALDLGGLVGAIERAITPRTKMVVLNSPSNPTGAVATPETLRALVALCRERGLWLLSDECYVQLVYDGAPASAGSAEGAKDCVVIAGSLSKTYAMTGWRLGYALGPAAVVAAMAKLQSQSTSNATTFVQAAACAALTAPEGTVDRDIARMRAAYRERRDLIVAGLRAVPGIECRVPSGAFYAFPNVRGLLGRKGGPATAAELAGRLLHEAGVVAVPGEAFGVDGHLRFSYACSTETIREGLARVGAFAEALLK